MTWTFGPVLLGIVVLIGMMARQFHGGRLKKFRQVKFSKGITGAEFARRILKAKGIEDVEIVESRALIIDHYEPGAKEVRLSADNYNGKDLAAAGMAAHVAGHAIQHAVGHKPVHWRTSAIKFAALGEVVVALASAGLIFNPKVAMMALGLGLALVRFYSVMTLPIEFDASGRAKDVIYNARLVSAGKEFDQLEEMLHAANLDKLSGFTRFWSWIFSWIFPWRKK
ncbi:MAG: zinc metallopeptidase [Verrucomicrobiota bacterium]